MVNSREGVAGARVWGAKSETVASKWLETRGKFPGFHLIRHALSILIFVFHAHRILHGGYESNLVTANHESLTATPTPLLEYFRPFLFSLVASFFILSGFLVAGSAERNRNPVKFVGLRAIRIAPALCVEVALSALILGPLLTSNSLLTYFSDANFFRYFGNIFGVVHFELPGVFVENRWSNIVNINLWTLPSEFHCYIAMTLMLAISLMRSSLFDTLVILSLLVIGSGLVLSDIYYGLNIRNGVTNFTANTLVYAFLVGVAYHRFGAWIPLKSYIFVCCGCIYYVLNIWNHGPIADLLSITVLAYCVVFLGSIDRLDTSSVFNLDLSYGIYLYGFPFEQTVAHFFPNISTIFLIFCALPVTILFAVASWELIERPALKLKRLI